MQAVTITPGVSLDIYGRVILGFQETFQRQLAAASEKSAGRVRYGGMVPYAKLPRKLAEYDVGVSLYDGKQINTQLASPAKMFESMRAGLALLSTDQPTPKRVIEETQSGYIVPVDQTEQLTNVLLNMVNDPGKVMQMRHNALNAFRSKYAYERQAAALLEWLERS